MGGSVPTVFSSLNVGTLIFLKRATGGSVSSAVVQIPYNWYMGGSFSFFVRSVTGINNNNKIFFAAL